MLKYKVEFLFLLHYKRIELYDFYLQFWLISTRIWIRICFKHFRYFLTCRNFSVHMNFKVAAWNWTGILKNLNVFIFIEWNMFWWYCYFILLFSLMVVLNLKKRVTYKKCYIYLLFICTLTLLSLNIQSFLYFALRLLLHESIESKIDS